MLFDGFKINLDDINDAVQLLMTNTVIAESYRFCFFLDGLDEFEDQALKHTEVAEYLRRWVSHNANGVKFCVSSREEPAFMTAFTSEQRLQLHLLTEGDIKEMVNERLMKHPQFLEYEPADQQKFALAVVSRAEGVFLWVHLLIKNELWDALDEGATVDDLFSLLHRVPEELDQFFAVIVNSIRKSNKQEAAMIFAVAIQTDGWRFPLHAFHYSFLEDFIENPDFSFTIPWGFLATSDSEGTSAGGHAQKIVKRLARFNRRLPGLCKGLLERAGGRNELLFIHRSVYDFLKTGPPESIKVTLDDASARTSFIIQCLTAETKCLDWLWYSLGRRSTVLGHVMDTLSSSPLDIQPFFAHLKHLDEALVLRQSGKPLANPKSMFDANFRRLAISGDSRGYLSVYTFARLWQLSTYVEWARQTYPSWIFEDQVGSELFYAAMRCRDSRRYASITLMLDNFLDPNGNSPIGNKMGTCSPWMVFIGEAFSNELITRETSGFWRTFTAFLANGADPLVHFRRQPHHSGVGELQMRSRTGTDVRECSFALPQNHGSFLHSFGASGRGRADLVDFVRHFGPPNMDEIIGLVQACMEEALGKTRWLSPLAWLPKRILDWSKPM
jgi:hypothetical protein